MEIHTHHTRIHCVSSLTAVSVLYPEIMGPKPNVILGPNNRRTSNIGYYLMFGYNMIISKYKFKCCDKIWVVTEVVITSILSGSRVYLIILLKYYTLFSANSQKHQIISILLDKYFINLFFV